MKTKFALPFLIQLCVISSIYCMDIEQKEKFLPLSLNSSINLKGNDQEDTQKIWKNAEKTNSQRSKSKIGKVCNIAFPVVQTAAMVTMVYVLYQQNQKIGKLQNYFDFANKTLYKANGFFTEGTDFIQEGKNFLNGCEKGKRLIFEFFMKYFNACCNETGCYESENCE